MSATITPKAGALNFTGNPPKFVRVEVTGLQDLQRRIAEHKDKYCPRRPIFRGYYTKYKGEGVSLEIEPSEVFITGLERAVHSIDKTLARAPQREIAITREFIRRAHHYSIALPQPEHYIEWLALMQHHGAPTRFLDWTYSVHVATHFALSHASRHVDVWPAVWMIDAEWAFTSSLAACGGPETLPVLAKRMVPYNEEPAASRELLFRKLPRSIWAINPFRLNERLTVQKGIFLAPGDVTASFVDNLTALEGHSSEANVTCFTIPSHHVENLSAELYDANISDTTLFPGLDGFAKSLWLSARHLSQPDDLTWKTVYSTGD